MATFGATRLCTYFSDRLVRRDQPFTFDMPESETDLVEAFTEYGSFKFGIFSWPNMLIS